ncbi:MAG: AAA family ATPase [Candidatus Nanoarchaeia archaeon]|jgi:NadR type nicotinamide-nucleotide adenylyltransferase
MNGLVIGKFMPPHQGHKYLVDFARNYCDKLTVMVCSIQQEPIEGKLRHEWMKESFPDVNVIHHSAEIPQEPKDHPDFWQIWHDAIYKMLPEGADCLFASEDYGIRLAEVLGMKYILATRDIIPLSGTEIRNNPMKHWDYILPAAKPYFLKRVCIFGPESTGKTTIAKNLAAYFKTIAVPEYARGLLDLKGGKCDYEDIELIARGQIASEDALARQANRILFCDTDILTTEIWSDILFGKCPQWIKNTKRDYDLYLLLDTNVPFVPDSQRYLPDSRQLSLERCIQELEKKGKKYVIISGNWEERLEKAKQEAEKLIGMNNIGSTI